MNQGFAPVFATPKSKQPENPPQPISMQKLQGSLSSYFDDVPDPRVNGSPDFMVYNVTNNTFIIMDFYLDYILDLPEVKVESCTQIEGKILLGLRIVGEGMVCHHCQNYTEQLHQNRPILVRDLPVFGRPVYLKVPRRQFYCPNCQRYPTEKIDFLDFKRRHTQRYEQNIYERVQQSNMEQIGREEQLSYDEIKGIFEQVIKLKKKQVGSQLSESLLMK